MAAPKFPHPVDVLKDRGVNLTPEQEAELRAYCDEKLTEIEQVFLYGEPQFPIKGILGM